MCVSTRVFSVISSYFLYWTDNYWLLVIDGNLINLGGSAHPTRKDLTDDVKTAYPSNLSSG